MTYEDQIIKQDTSLSYRVFNLNDPFNENRTASLHQAIGGYSPAKLRRYQDVIDRHLSKNNLDVLNMLNAKYLITGDEKEPVQEIPGAMGNAWFVTEIKAVNSPDQELESLDSFDPKKVAFVDVSKFKLSNTAFDSLNGSIVLKENRLNRLSYSSNSVNDGFAVFSEIFYEKGWQAAIDGKPVDIIRANYILRALYVPKGSHTITFEFKPQTYYMGNTISSIASIILLLSLAGSVLISYLTGYKSKNVATNV
ncbi:MAG: YfhO family protein [Cytophagales bacterium]|nr:YfhO family protein [Cytophagales bacterium]